MTPLAEGPGWRTFAAEPGLDRWLEAAGRAALAAETDPETRAAWLRHGGTWFAGVGVLPNDAQGRVAGSDPLDCAALRAAFDDIGGPVALDRGQVSVTYPGYPRRDPSETEAAHQFRARRDAAHLDGLLPIGPRRRRMMREPHGFILGIALTDCPAGHAPLVVWEGSHEVMRRALRGAVSGHDPAEWPDIDVTEVYASARREIFESCVRRPLALCAGQSVLLHRLALHGVAPWSALGHPDARRAMLYFRPELPGGVADWLTRP